MNKIIETKRPGRKFPNPALLDKLTKLKVGKSLIIKRADWPLKTRPGQYVLRRQTGLEFSSRTLADDSGWFITKL